MHVSFRKNYVRNISTPHSDWLCSSFIAFVLWILTMINHQCEFFSQFWHFQFWLAASKIIYWQMSESASLISYRNGMWWTEGPDKLYYFLRVELFFLSNIVIYIRSHYFARRMSSLYNVWCHAIFPSHFRFNAKRGRQRSKWILWLVNK